MSKLATQSKMTENGPVEGKAKKRHDARLARAAASQEKVGKGDGTERNPGGYKMPGSMNAKKTGRN